MTGFSIWRAVRAALTGAALAVALFTAYLWWQRGLYIVPDEGGWRFAEGTLRLMLAVGFLGMLAGIVGAAVAWRHYRRLLAELKGHLGALIRLAQLAVALGASLDGLDDVPDAVEAALARDLGVQPPLRLLELIGAGPNQWTAAEGALKIRETSRIATEGLSVEQFFHGPSVAVDERDALVCLDCTSIPALVHIATVPAPPKSMSSGCATTASTRSISLSGRGFPSGTLTRRP